MLVINARNVNDAWRKAIPIILKDGVSRPSRYGPVLEYPDPVTTVYEKPWERVLFDPRRNANPFFHLFESLWMLAGRNDVAWLARFLPRMAEFSDDGKIFHGAYGWRWLNHFDMYGGGDEDETDQLGKIIRMLQNNPDERRAVLQMWDPVADLGRVGKDVPCNVTAFFKVRQQRLEMTVACRSNDIILGCLGANAVHFSMLHEYVSTLSGYPQGRYFQVSDSWHMYTESSAQYLPENGQPENWGSIYENTPTFPLFEHPLGPTKVDFGTRESWGHDLQKWMRIAAFAHSDEALPHTNARFNWPFFQKVAFPLLQSFNAWKNRELDLAIAHATACEALDWRLACVNWLHRRQFAQKNKGKESTVNKALKIQKRLEKLRLIGVDGNAFSLLAQFHKQARTEGWTPEEIEIVLKEARSGDYNHLLGTLMRYAKEVC